MSLATHAMAQSAVAYFQSTVQHTCPGTLTALGLTPQQVRAAFHGSKDLRPSAIRRAIVSAYPKRRGGGVRMPAHVVAAMYADYREVGLSKAAAIHGRTHQALLALFHSHRMPLLHSRRSETRTFNGHVYHRARTGYFVRKWVEHGILKHEFLHVAMYASHFGPPPKGHRVIFENGDRSDIRPGNLTAVTAREQIARAIHTRWAKRKGACC